MERVKEKQEEKITKLKTESNEKSFKKSIIEHQKKKEDKTSSRIKNILNCEKEIDSKFHTEKTKIKKR